MRNSPDADRPWWQSGFDESVNTAVALRGLRDQIAGLPILEGAIDGGRIRKHLHHQPSTGGFFHVLVDRVSTLTGRGWTGHARC
ncbi:hypothetical protein [Streptomyces sp. NRRL S-1824]|uniref:hypothetical protein n=1 Tax=Streptomyces sp. NRRL S-1824 TaxID=1463889 RepID=UPI0004C6E4A5|nr:hypothetical protein [Streptomyces sp. NRRL S-1824]